MTQAGSGGSGSGSGPGAKGVRGWHARPLATLPDREQTARLTLDFSGPLLPLPEGDIDDLPQHVSPARTSGHDAWAVDHVRRSTPPPMQVKPGWLEQGLERGTRPGSEPPVPPPAEKPLSVAPQGTAFDLVDSVRPSFSGVDLHQEMADRFALGDFSGALGIAELILGTRGDDPAAAKYAEACREKLEHFYAARVGSLAAALRVVVRDSDVRWLGLDHRAGFLLSRIDSQLTIDELLDTSGMPRLEALRTISDLLDLKAIEVIRPGVRAPRR